MKKFLVKLLCIASILLIENVAFGQVLSGGSYKDYFTEGSYLMLEENYGLALLNMQKAYELDSTNANVNFLLGECYLHSATEKNKAETYLAKAVTNVKKHYKHDDYTEKAAPPQAFLYYAKALHINYKFDEAIQYYNKFLEFIGPTAAKAWQKEVNYYKDQSVYAKKQVAAPINVKIINMGDSINSPYPDYSPVLSADERMMIFTTRRPNGVCGEKTSDGQYFEDIVVSYKDDNGYWSKPVQLSEYVNTCGHEASINLSPDGQTLIVYKDENGNGNIYYSQWDGKAWGSLQQFGSDVNTEFWETHACLSNDGNTLYFVSDRPGGLGGRDIYRVVKLPNGKWSKALNLGSVINTPYDEDGVFMHPDGKTLFFASKGHQTMGGFDIFFSIADEDGKFSEPFNVAYPINTPDDDIFYVTSPDGKRAYYSSFKEGGFGDKDIYMITIPESSDKSLVVYKGKIQPAQGENLPEDLSIILKDKETGEVIGIYKPQKNGNFVFILKPGKTYDVSYQANGQEFYSDEIYADKDATYKEIHKAIELEPINMLGKIAVKQRAYKLDIIVLNSVAQKLPAKLAKVTITDNAGTSKTFDIDETANGKVIGIALAPNNKYTITVESDGKTMKQDLTTDGEDKAKQFTKVFYLRDKGEKTPTTPSTLPKSKYEFYFTYLKYQIDTTADVWNNFIDNIVEKSKAKKVSITIESSASKVPTLMTNPVLAKMRGERLKDKITKAVSAKGGDIKKLKFNIIKKVQGPPCNLDKKDQENKREIFEKYQYVKATAK